MNNNPNNIKFQIMEKSMLLYFINYCKSSFCVFGVGIAETPKIYN